MYIVYILKTYEYLLSLPAPKMFFNRVVAERNNCFTAPLVVGHGPRVLRKFCHLLSGSTSSHVVIGPENFISLVLNSF